VRGCSSLARGDLAALGSLRMDVKQKEKEIASRRVECQKTFEAQQGAMLGSPPPLPPA
jgi:hypothetical protein